MEVAPSCSSLHGLSQESQDSLKAAVEVPPDAMLAVPSFTGAGIIASQVASVESRPLDSAHLPVDAAPGSDGASIASNITLDDVSLAILESPLRYNPHDLIGAWMSIVELGDLNHADSVATVSRTTVHIFSISESEKKLFVDRLEAILPGLSGIMFQ